MTVTEIRPRDTYTCHKCKQNKANEYYAKDSSGNTFCDDCAHASEMDYIATHDKTTIYGPRVLFQGEKVTDWPGGELGTLVEVGSKPHPFTRRSYWGAKYYCKIRMNIDGSLWAGWLGEGLACNIKRIG